MRMPGIIFYRSRRFIWKEFLQSGRDVYKRQGTDRLGFYGNEGGGNRPQRRGSLRNGTADTAGYSDHRYPHARLQWPEMCIRDSLMWELSLCPLAVSMQKIWKIIFLSTKLYAAAEAGW